MCECDGYAAYVYGLVNLQPCAYQISLILTCCYVVIPNSVAIIICKIMIGYSLSQFLFNVACVSN